MNQKIKNTDNPHIRILKETHDKLLKKYKKGKPDPFRMRSARLIEEWNLLEKLVGTVFMTQNLLARWMKVNRAHASLIVCDIVYPH
jgi:hypothetical protein